jgi:hypothetical protein
LILGVIKLSQEQLKTNYSLTRQAKLRLYNWCKPGAINAIPTFIFFAPAFFVVD